MSDAIIVAFITLIGTIITVIATSKTTQNKVTHELETQNAIQNQKIDQLGVDIETVKSELVEKIDNNQDITDLKIDTLSIKQVEMARDIKEHNNYAKQLPEIQGKLDLISEKQGVANNRISDLEVFQKEMTNRMINNK